MTRTMRRCLALALLAHASTACGARTGFDLDDASSGTAAGDASESASGGGSTAGVFCALQVGPVSSCVAPVSDGPVQQCDAVFRHCVNVGGQWGCCNGDANNNGAGGSCRFVGGCEISR
jgi:hypothetical protein